MTRNWRTAQVILRSDVVETLERKYGVKIEEVLEELAYQDVCKRVLNRCIECHEQIFLWILRDDWKAQETFRKAKAKCKNCLKTSRWRKIK